MAILTWIKFGPAAPASNLIRPVASERRARLLAAVNALLARDGPGQPPRRRAVRRGGNQRPVQNESVC